MDRQSITQQQNMLGARHWASASCQVRYSTAVPLETRGNVREVCRVQAGMKGKQHGSKLMQAICEEADRCVKILILMPDSARLEKWYNKHGFVKVQDNPVIMLRQPAVIATRGINERRE